MASADSYLSVRFGEFFIASRLGTGLTREVYECIHVPTEVAYALKLHVDDDPLWDGEPLIPPANGAFQGIEALRAWMMMESTFGGPSNTPHQWRVVDDRYLACVTAPFRPRGAWPIERLIALDRPRGSLGDMVPAYDDAVHMMASEALLGNLDDAAWQQRWGAATGGTYLMEKAGLFVAGNPVAERRLSAQIQEQRELADNLIIRMLDAYGRSEMTVAELEATLRSAEFWRNRSIHEGEQILTVARAFHSGSRHYGSATLGEALNSLVHCLNILHMGVLSEEADVDAFERVEDKPPEVQPEWVVLQDMGAREQG